MFKSAEQVRVEEPQEDMEKKPEDLKMQPEEGPETLENLEELVQKKIESAEAELEGLGGEEKRVADCNRAVNLPPDELEKVKTSFGLVKKLEDISRRAKEAMGVLMAGLILAAGSIDANVARASVDSKVKSEIGTEEVAANKDKERERENAELYYKKIAELKESAYKDSHEKFTIVSKNNGNLEFAESVGEKNFGYIDFGKIENAIKNGSEKIEIIHTHPLGAYTNYSPEEIEKIRTGESKPNPMPLSSTDLFGVIQELNHFKADFSRIENKIIDPTGEWNIKIDEDNSFIKKYSKFVKFIENYKDDEFLKKEFGLSGEALEDLRIKKQLEVANTHPELRINILDSDPSTKKLAEKIREKFEKKSKEIFSTEELADFDEIFSNIAFSITNKKTIKAEREVFIDKLIDKFKKYGVIVTYKPFEDKK